ncbi:MAG: M48 family metallopeptidase [Desulfobulbus sp.]|uniref:M48 family metallopeptidase n=1 Tax=Desulfobulbus sp. TaxID=895 RepID=UPI00284D366E|nr:M48 family metallopeptidase [Desulfobulbus sp.]MDR2549560.1 M48 family metallopeptidase [Desulfobulbus sp.]
MDISGNYFDGHSSRPCPAVLCRTGKGAGVFDPAGTRLAWVEDALGLDIASRVGDTKRFVRFPDGGVFETGDNDAVDRLAASLRPGSGLTHRLESRLRYAAIGLVVTILFTWGSIQYGIPLLARAVAFSISAENNRRIGQGALEALDRAIFSPSGLPLAEQERLRGRFLAGVGTVDGIPLSVEFREADKSIGANAFALPSGTIVFTDQLVRLAQNDEELLGIFYHEAGHVQWRHAMRGILQQSALAAVIVAVTGDVSSVASLVSAAPVFLVEAGYSRRFESEADAFAVARMREAHLDPAHFGRILARLEEAHRAKQDEKGKKNEKNDSQPRLGDYLSTHPATAERIDQVEK